MTDSIARVGRFEIRRNLGAGGMGVVYEALDRERHLKVALKRLRALGPDALLYFKQEFRDFQHLHHPNLVAMGELFSEGGDWYLSMELIDGQSFLSWVRPGTLEDGSDSVNSAATTGIWADLASDHETVSHRWGGACDIPRLRAAIIQLTSGLLALHDAGKIHRDIKPSNVLVTPSGRVVLLDFGLAASVGRDGSVSDIGVVGTIDYMAPEQAARKPVGPEADWYAVGIMIHEALTGHVPLTGHPLEVMQQKQYLDGVSPRALDPLIPEDLDSLCYDLLRFDPSKRPDGHEVLRRLGAAVPHVERAPSSTLQQTPLFIGREGELEELGDAYGRSRDGAAVLALVGESGVGKTSLVRRFTERLVADVPGVVVLSGTCYEQERVPFKGVDDVIDALGRYMRRLPKAQAAALLPRHTGLVTQVFPVLGRVEAVAEAPRVDAHGLDPRVVRDRVFAALRELFGRLADRHPLVIVIDDLHWSDADSLALLAELVRPPESPALLLVGTVRASASLDPLTRALPGLVTLAVERLPPPTARALAAELLVRADAPPWLLAERVAEEADGHPLFIDELVRFGVERDPAARAPVTLEDALWTRIILLEPLAREILEVVSLASGRVTQDVVARAAGTNLGAIASHIGFLRAAHLVRTAGTRGNDVVEPYHGRIRGAVLFHLKGERAEALHRRLALALETTGHADPEALALHWRAAGDDARAALNAVQAADKAARALAFDRAVGFYQMALELGASDARGLKVKLADALSSAGRGAEAGHAYLEVAAEVPAEEAVNLHRQAAEQLLRSGHLDEGLAAVQSVLRSAGLSLPKTPRGAMMSLLTSRARVRLRGLRYKERAERDVPAALLAKIDVCSAVSCGLGAIDTIRGADFQARQLVYALEAGEPLRVARALAMETAFSALGGTKRRARTDALLATVMPLAQRLGHPLALGLTRFGAGLAAFFGGRFVAGGEHLADAEQLFAERCTGVSWELDTTRFIGLFAAFYRGDVVELRRRVPRLVHESDARGDRYAFTNWATTFLPMVRLFADQPDQATTDVNEALAAWSRQGFHLQHLNGTMALAEADLYRGDGAAAVARLAEEWPAIARSLLLSIQQARIRATYLRACAWLATGDVNATAKAATQLDRERAAWATAMATALRAGLARRAGTADAVGLYEQAASRFAAEDMGLYAAAARIRLGLARADDDGNEILDEASRWMEDRGVVDPERLAAMMVP